MATSRPLKMGTELELVPETSEDHPHLDAVVAAKFAVIEPASMWSVSVVG